jgi:transcriptional regulator with XRE-family HTH domain
MELLDGRPKTWLARALGVSVATVTNWVTGETMMPYDKAREAAKLFGVDMEELYEEVRE